MEIKIRPLVEEDAYTSVKWRNDPEIFRFTGNTYDHEITIESELNWIRRVIRNQDEYRCAILVDSIYVGNIYLTDIDRISAHYHIFIGNKDYWGRGIAKQASQLILHYAFHTLGLQFVQLRVHKENISALELYKQLGFKKINADEIWLTMRLNSVISYTDQSLNQKNTI
ncbi:MAG: GNAT family N-acetyltransferase [Prevotella sp.]|nr:GNAT family N-acetyltransferase [Prevotella sp.]